MNGKMIGGILLIMGTAIGAGILALPLATAAAGFLDTVLLLVVCWLISTFAAFLLLEVNLWLPENSNIISMAKETLGMPGKVIAWIIYLFLLYCLTSAYISGGTDVLHGLLSEVGVDIPLWLSSVLFVLVLGYIVFLGIRLLDYVNRSLMSIKLVVFFLLILAILPFVKLNILPVNHPYFTLAAMTVAITSFGHSIVVPSLRTYLKSDIKVLRITLIIGSTMPLVLYIIWVLVIQGVVSSTGAHGLIAIDHGGQTTTHLVNRLVNDLQKPWIAVLSRFFVSVCMLTSFLAVSLSLSDFLSDGLSIPKKGFKQIWVYALTFLPGLLIVIFKPSIFIFAISYAGIACIALLILMPMLMVWRGRYVLGKTGYRVFPNGGKLVILIAFIFSIVLLVIALLQVVGIIPPA